MEFIFSECSDEDEKLLLQVHRMKSLVLKVNQRLKYCNVIIFMSKTSKSGVNERFNSPSSERRK
jgi:hypothetical protein